MFLELALGAVSLEIKTFGGLAGRAWKLSEVTRFLSEVTRWLSEVTRWLSEVTGPTSERAGRRLSEVSGWPPRPIKPGPPGRGYEDH